MVLKELNLTNPFRHLNSYLLFCIILVLTLLPNVRRYVHVAAASRWHGFLPSFWMWRFFRFTKSSRSAKTMTPGGSAPAFSRGQPAGFCEAALAARAGLINHRLVFGVLVELSARKNQPKAIAYTDLL